jgi:hypothetical protein
MTPMAVGSTGLAVVDWAFDRHTGRTSNKTRVKLRKDIRSPVQGIDFDFQERPQYKTRNY